MKLALHYDPRVHKSDTCKNVLLSRSRDDLVLQLSQRVYTRRNPNWGPTLQFTLAWVRGSGRLPHGLSRDPPAPLPVPVEPARPKVSRDEQQREVIARMRDEIKALKSAKRDCVGDSRQFKAENDALRREVQQLQATNDAQYAELLKLGSSHEFQRQHIEHLRRKIQDLQQQLSAQKTATTAASTREPTGGANAAPVANAPPLQQSVSVLGPGQSTALQPQQQAQSQQTETTIPTDRTADDVLTDTSATASASKRRRAAQD